jgi:5'-nucleotidase (lipoprotein e(P4) family)
MRRTLGVALLATLLFVGLVTAQATQPAAVATPAAAVATPTTAVATSVAAVATPAASDELNAVLWTQRAVEHDLVFEEVYRAAAATLPAALADPTWDAIPHEERSGSPAKLAPAVIFDVDETLLDNSPYEAQLVRSGEEFNEFTWSQWCRKEAARPLPGALDFVHLAASRGVAIYYITNRAVDLDAATLANLRKAGFPAPDAKVLLGLGTVVPGCEMLGTEKGCRRRLVARDHRVLMQFGDQIGDFVDVIANTPDDRGKSVAPYASWIGERWWVLPNPLYGSWQPACFNNDWTLPRGKRRAAEIKYMRTE